MSMLMNFRFIVLVRHCLAILATTLPVFMVMDMTVVMFVIMFVVMVVPMIMIVAATRVLLRGVIMRAGLFFLVRQ